MTTGITGPVDGASVALVEDAIADDDPLPGTTGFAGRLPDGRLVRDILGRRPLFVEGEVVSTLTTDGHRPSVAFDPRHLRNPRPHPAGVVTRGGEVVYRFRLPDPEPRDPETALSSLERAIDAALADVPDTAAVAFSGGVDSALVATATNGTCYTVGFPDGRDLGAARDGARALDSEHRVVELDHDRLRVAARSVVEALDSTDPMAVQIAVPLYLVASEAAADGATHLALGQGADELFGGYEKVAHAPRDDRVTADTVRGARREVLGGLPDQLERDLLAVRSAGVEPLVPLLDDQVIRASLALPGALLVDDHGERKVALRRVARSRLPARVAYREKRAIQYGTLVSRELDRLARQAGFKRREGDHVSRYLDSL